jgi:hypothetical protein
MWLWHSPRDNELSARKSAVADALDALRAKRPAGHHPDEIVAMLDADLRPALNAASEEELVEIFRAFDLTITYDKHEQRLHLAATITPELLAVLCPTTATALTPQKSPDLLGNRDIAPVTVYRIEESWPLGQEPVWRQSLARAASRVGAAVAGLAGSRR